MISRTILLSAVIAWSGAGLLPPAEVQPPTAQQLRDKARHKSRSDVCAKKRKSKTVRELCTRWGEPT